MITDFSLGFEEIRNLIKNYLQFTDNIGICQGKPLTARNVTVSLVRSLVRAI